MSRGHWPGQSVTLRELVQRKIFASCGQEAFLEGHVHALRVLSGVPRSKIRYDNLRAAVSQVLGCTRGRGESEHWTASRPAAATPQRAEEGIAGQPLSALTAIETVERPRQLFCEAGNPERR